MNVIERYFGIDGRNTTIKLNSGRSDNLFDHGLYYLVNPDMLAKAGMDKGAVFVATCLASALGCFNGIDCAFARGIGTWHGSKCVFYLYRRLGDG